MDRYRRQRVWTTSNDWNFRMISVAHLVDDSAVGGVTRFLDALTGELGEKVRQSRISVKPLATLPPRIDADVVIVHFTMSWSKLPFLLALRARFGTRPIVLVEHSYSAAFERLAVPAPHRFRMMLRSSYRLVDRVVSVSYGQARWMRAAHLLPADKLSVIYPFTDCTELAALQQPAPKYGPLSLGAYGRYCAQKDFSTLLAAMSLIDPAIATLTLRGFGPDTKALTAQAEPLSNVNVGAKIDNLSDFLSTVDAIAVPSRFEPFGQVAYEARLAGRPIIVTDVDGLPEQVDELNGLVVPVGNAEVLAGAIRQMAVSRRLGPWSEMCQAAHMSASTHTAISAGHWKTLLGTLGTSNRPFIGANDTSQLLHQHHTH